ncbi:nuclear transport factor 2 family protein [Streptosporangium sandarakinum]|uniref:nuclear transport factor 2 family protein n=1 Tax=Streptosporangium sandarakinum TaxID=1260955 RepID=UPI00370FE0EC
MPDFHAFPTHLPHEPAFSHEDPATIVDRCHTPDLEHHNDGIILDRRRLIDHTGPARRNTREPDIRLHETLLDGDRAAARHTMTVLTGKDRTLRVEVHPFARLAPDGRIHRVHSITRTVEP